MHLKTVLTLCLLLLLNTGNSFAKESNLRASLSFVNMSMDYREYDRTGQIIDSEESEFVDITGVELGLEHSFAKEPSSFSTLKLNFMVVGGETIYIGSYLASGQPYGSVVSTTHNTLIDTDISYEINKLLSNNFTLSYGIGFGYSEWERALSTSQVEVYKWYSLRPVLGLSVTLQEKVNLGLFLEYQYGFNTVMTSTNPNLDFTLGGVNTWEISLPIRYKYTQKIDLIFETRVQKQTIKASNVNSGYYEPDSTAHNKYLKFGLEFKF